MTVPAYGDDALSPKELEEYIIDNAQAIVDAGEDQAALQKEIQQLKATVEQLTQALEKSIALTKAYADTKASQAEQAAKAHANAKASQAEQAAKAHANVKASQAEKNAKSVANDARNRANNAQSTANDARNRAKTAQSTANDAKTRAINAQSTANRAVSKVNRIKLECVSGKRIVSRPNSWSSYSTCPSDYTVVGLQSIDIHGNAWDNNSNVNSFDCNDSGCKAWCVDFNCTVISRCCRVVIQ
jgi:cell division septum initiation protein DivIVA